MTAYQSARFFGGGSNVCFQLVIGLDGGKLIMHAGRVGSGILELLQTAYTHRIILELNVIREIKLLSCSIFSAMQPT